jgi:hypothetical protein
MLLTLASYFIEGQEKRQNMGAKIAPLVLDKHGNPEPTPPKVQRMAKEIVECSGANSEQLSTA